MPPLHPAHLADLKKSGLTPETIRAAGVYTVPPAEIGKKLGGLGNGVVSALAFPYPGCDGFERYKVWRGENADPKAAKYLQRTGTPNRLYLPPAVDLAGDSPLIVVEGEKKCLALWQAGFQVVGLGGVWNWCVKGEGYKKPQESQPIPDLDRVNWRRPVTILFDSDGYGERTVRLAAFRLARQVAKRGAVVSILFLPKREGGGKVGADDFLVAHGPEVLADLLKTAWPFDPKLDDRAAEVAWLLRDLTPDTPLPEKLRALAALTPTLARLSHFEAEGILSDLASRLKLHSKFLSALRKDSHRPGKSRARDKRGKLRRRFIRPCFPAWWTWWSMRAHRLSCCWAKLGWESPPSGSMKVSCMPPHPVSRFPGYFPVVRKS